MSPLAENTEEHVDSDSQNLLAHKIQYAHFKRRETRKLFSGVLSRTDTKTWS